jgi:hypothetical protein
MRRQSAVSERMRMVIGESRWKARRLGGRRKGD